MRTVSVTFSPFLCNITGLLQGVIHIIMYSIIHKIIKMTVFVYNWSVFCILVVEFSFHRAYLAYMKIYAIF